MAQTSVFIPAGPTGLTAFVQTFDPLSCAVSDLMTIVL
jgi:hypothetical protein